MKSRIAIVKPGDFARAPKGTIVRSTTAKILQSIIKQLYSELDDPAAKKVKQSLSGTGDRQVRILQLVKDYVHEFDKLAAANDEDDLFQFGLDSLVALEIVKSIRTGLLTYFDQK